MLAASTLRWGRLGGKCCELGSFFRTYLMGGVGGNKGIWGLFRDYIRIRFLFPC